jgi:hypothetical protein
MAKWFKDELSKNWQGKDINNYPPKNIIYSNNHN